MNDITNNPGTYVLVMRLSQQRRCRIGSLGIHTFHLGHFLYVGSARGPGGLRARIRRHRRREKALHWHVDYLRRVTALTEVWFSEDQSICECWLASLLGEIHQPAARGFGSSDCRCDTHLFFSEDIPAVGALPVGMNVSASFAER